MPGRVSPSGAANDRGSIVRARRAFVMARILIVAFGSLGDLHPAIGLALELKSRGHHAAIGTSEFYRAKISAAGLGFHPVRPNFSLDDEVTVQRIMDGTAGSEYLMRELVFPAVRDMHADLVSVAPRFDLLVSAELVVAAPIIAAQLRLPWVFYALSPISFFPLRDPPLLPGPPGSHLIQSLGPGANQLFKLGAKLFSYPWWRPVRKLRRELGLPAGGTPLFEGKFSPHLNLALFSSALQPPQPDWPANTVQTGFVFHDEDPPAAAVLPPEVERFLSAGPPPLVFTLGSAAVMIARDFYTHAAAAATRLGQRAILLLGGNPPPPNLPDSILPWNYLPYGRLFPRASIIVHQGGAGTTAQVLRAGRPMVVVPFAHDQFDNAARMRRRGVARVIARSSAHGPALAAAIESIRSDSHARSAAAACATVIARETGPTSAAVSLEKLLGSCAITRTT